jgi:tetratricopeptide (TPR) repeat protein
MKELVQAIELHKLEVLLTNVERRAEAATSLEQKARVYNLAGDLCFDAQQPERALHYYELAINMYITADQYEHAIDMCKKLIALTAQTVHVGYTLAWLTATRGLISEAKLAIEEYVRVADAAGLTRLARKHLRTLAEITTAADIVHAIHASVGREVTEEWIMAELDRMQGKRIA